MMSTKGRRAAQFALAGIMAGALALPALAGGSVKDDPAPEARKFTHSFNIGVTSDYVFRGYSQRAEDPALQGGIDIGYGIFYAGVWASMLDFGTVAAGFPNAGRDVANTEVDFYAGIKPTWGRFNFDFGAIYYAYPGAKDNLARDNIREADYFELKAGVSTSPVDKLTTGITVFYSPDYTNRQDSVTTVEGAVAYELPKVGVFTPTIGGVLGTSIGSFDSAAFAAGRNAGFVLGNGDDSYVYWNAGLALAVDALTLDFRYWDTNVSDSGPVFATGACKGPVFACDERFVFSAKVTF